MRIHRAVPIGSFVLAALVFGLLGGNDIARAQSQKSQLPVLPSQGPKIPSAPSPKIAVPKIAVPKVLVPEEGSRQILESHEVFDLTDTHVREIRDMCSRLTDWQKYSVCRALRPTTR